MQELLLDIINTRRCDTKRELKNRKDVVNKTLIRAVKRFFANLFRRMFPPKRFRNQSLKFKHLKKTLLEFSGIYTWNLKHSQAFVLLGFLLDAKNFSQLTKKQAIEEVEEVREFAAKFNKCCSSYSHFEFETVSRHRFFRNLYLVFKDNGLEEFLAIQEESSQNSEEYRGAIEKLELRLTDF